MATTELCPVEHPGERSGEKRLSIKANALAFMRNGESELDELSPDDIPLPRLKLEADSMTAIILNLLKNKLFNEETRDWAADSIDRSDYSHRGELLELGGKEVLYMVGYVFDEFYGKLKETEAGQELLERTDHYRGAYFRRSPLSGREEKIYASTKQLVWAGLNTLGHQGPRVIYAVESGAILAKMSPEERIALVKNSGHMAILLSKLSLADLSRYVDSLNDYEEVIHAMAKIEESDGLKPTIHFNRRFLEFMRSTDGKDKSRFDHREHTGCVGAVDLDGTGSPLSKGWLWLVEIMEKAGYWDESWVEAASRQEPA